MLSSPKVWIQKLGQFIKSEKASVGLTFGIASISLIALTGVAIDYARAHLIKKEISRGHKEHVMPRLTWSCLRFRFIMLIKVYT